MKVPRIRVCEGVAVAAAVGSMLGVVEGAEDGVATAVGVDGAVAGVLVGDGCGVGCGCAVGVAAGRCGFGRTSFDSTVTVLLSTFNSKTTSTAAGVSGRSLIVVVA
jgi:hypothetical protein